MSKIIPFPGNSQSVEDDFCGMDGFVPENKLYALETAAMTHISFAMHDSDTATVEYHGADALTEEFKQLLLEVLYRRQRENVRAGRVLTVSHPLMERDQQIPFLAERSEVPAITVRMATDEDLKMMESLRDIFPVLADIRNGLRSRMKRRLPGFFV